MLLFFLLLAVYNLGQRVFHGVSELLGSLGITQYHSLSDARSLSPVSLSALRMALSPGEGNGNPLQYSCLENPLDRGAWPATVHGVTMSWGLLSNRAQQCHQGSPKIYFLTDHF